MSLTIAVLAEQADHEKRVAVSVETVKKLIDLGCSIKIESGAGDKADIPDTLFKEAGAKISKGAEETLKGADILLCVQAPQDNTMKALKKNALVIGGLAPYKNEKILDLGCKQNLILMSMDLMPRITRAQSMDILSSQSNLSGYKAVLDACEYYGRAFPMMMTAAGTVPPAKAFVMGAGVAGLQAIATAKRLGAVVSATDVRPAAKEQVESLGASFVAVEDDEFKEAETAGGYAKEMSAAYKKKQAALVEEHIQKQDIVITTALIPGRPAPKLITAKMVESMKPGSVIVDLAVETGGNCEMSKPGEVVTTKNGVKIIGHLNVPSRLAADASALYAKNVFNLLKLLIDAEKKALNIDWKDDIVQGITLTKDGKIVHGQFSKGKSSSNTSSKPAAAKKDTENKKPAAKKKTASSASKTKKKDS